VSVGGEPIRVVRPMRASRMRRATARSAAAVVTGSFLLVAACAEPPPPDCAPMAEGVEVLENRGAGLWAERGLRPSLRELWMRGGTREGEALAVPLPPAAGPEGRLAIPDFRAGEVVIVEADGTWRGSATRRGSGPGEVRRPAEVDVCPKNFPGHAERIDGAPGRALPFPRNLWFLRPRRVDRGGHSPARMAGSGDLRSWTEREQVEIDGLELPFLGGLQLIEN